MQEREVCLLRTLLQELYDVFQRTGLPGPWMIPLPEPLQQAIPFSDQSIRPIERITRLTPVVTALRSEATRGLSGEDRYRYLLKPLSMHREAMLPQFEEQISGYLREDYRQIWQQFLDAMRQIQSYPPGEAYFFTVYFLVKKYFTRVPSREMPDISVFDHARITTAIEDCRHMYHKEKGRKKTTPIPVEKSSDMPRPPSSAGEETVSPVFSEAEPQGSAASDEEKEFLFIEGDLSGIQNFMFAMGVPRQEARRLTNRLRGCSFYLWLLAETIVEYLLKSLNLTIAHQVWSAGGRFLLIAPNTPAVTYHLKACYHEIKTFLLQKFRGDLALVIGNSAVSAKELDTQFALVQRNLTHIMAHEALRPFSSVLQEQDLVQFPSFPPEDAAPYDQFLTQLYHEQDYIGQHLSRLNQGDNRLMKKVKAASESWQKKPFITVEIGKVFHLAWDIDTEADAQTETMYRINDLDAPFWGTTPLQYGFKLLAIHTDDELLNEAPVVVTRDDVPQSDQSDQSVVEGDRGNDVIGVLRMDVDRVEALLTAGFPLQKHNLMHVAALSAEIDLFFTGYIQHLCRTEFRKSVHLIHAGGDDLCVVGAWDALINFACRIANDFTAFTCHHPELHLSGGLWVCKERYPLNWAAQQASLLLNDLAKENSRREPDLRGKIGERDALALFDHRLSWKDVLTLCQQGDQFVEAVCKNEMSLPTLCTLRSLHRTWNRCKTLNTARMYYLTAQAIHKTSGREQFLAQHQYLAHPGYIPILLTYVALKTKKSAQGGVYD